MTFTLIKDKFLLVITGIGFVALMFVVSPLIIDYIDIVFIVIVFAVLFADRREINRLRAEVKQLKSQLT